MREASVSIDDITVQAAKGKLVTLGERPGHAEAMQPLPRATRAGQYVLFGLTLMFGVLIYACQTTLGPGVLRILLVLVLAALGVFCLLAALGSAPEAVPAVWGAAVVAESHEKREGDSSPQHRLMLLDEQGAQHELVTSAEIAEALRIGDVGVAHVRAKQLVKFARL